VQIMHGPDTKDYHQDCDASYKKGLCQATAYTTKGCKQYTYHSVPSATVSMAVAQAACCERPPGLLTLLVVPW